MPSSTVYVILVPSFFFSNMIVDGEKFHKIELEDAIQTTPRNNGELGENKFAFLKGI